jgi:hypothetical protein
MLSHLYGGGLQANQPKDHNRESNRQKPTRTIADISDHVKNVMDKEPRCISTPLHKVAIAIVQVIKREKLEGPTKDSLDEIIMYIQGKEKKEWQRSKSKPA